MAPQRPLEITPVGGVDVAVNTAVKHELTAAGRLGLEEHGIHVCVRLDARSFGLHELRPSHLLHEGLPPLELIVHLTHCALSVQQREDRRRRPGRQVLTAATGTRVSVRRCDR